MRTVRYIIFIIVIIIFVIASAVTVASGGENIPLVAATAVLTVIAFPSTAEWAWDKVGPTHGFGKHDKQPTSPGTIEDYLNGRLRAFADEEKRFIPLELSLKPAYKEGDAEPTDDIEAIFKQNNGRFILLGDPGAGKSTTLRHLMRQAINNYLRYPKDNRIPIWINLGEGANPINPDELLQHWWSNRCYLPGTPDADLNNYNLLLFLDGLNEMPLDTRSERAKLLCEFLEKNPEVQAIVTCRVRDYEDDEALKLPLNNVQVLPLDDTRVRNFIAKNGGADDLWNTIKNDDALRSLADNPYNLYQIIKISQEPDGRNLPRDLNQLYSRYLQVTYKRYTEDRKKKRKGEEETSLLKLPLPKLEKRLQNLAFAMLAQGKGTSTTLEWALHWRRRWRWGQQAIRDSVNLGILVSDGNSLRFYHQSLHGYFAVEPLGRALTVNGGFDRFTKNPVALISQIGDLGTTGMPAVEPLIKVLEDRGSYVRSAAARALGAIKDERAIQPLIKALIDQDSDVQEYVMGALGQIGEPAIQPFIKVIDNDKSLLYFVASKVFGEIGEPAVEPLIKMLTDKDKIVRECAAEALGDIKDERAVVPLIEMLTNKDDNVRRVAARSLGSIKDERAVIPLIEALRDTDAILRINSAEALGRIKDERAVEPLINSLRDENRFVRGAAVRALGRIENERAIEALIEAFRDNDNDVREYAARALGQIGEPAFEPLIDALADKSVLVRQSAATALGIIRIEKVIEPLIEALTDTGVFVQIAAAEALGRIKDEQAVEPLIKTLTNAKLGMGIAVVNALTQIGTMEAKLAAKKWKRENGIKW